MNHPEILAPVGTWDMLRAAVHNGADAVYIGMPGFNARGRAATLEVDDLRAMIEYAHLYGVKVFLAFNILIFEREIEDVVDALHEVLPLRPDAFIVQDIGLVRLIRFMAPEQEVHASTQMTVTSVEAIEATEDLGMTRYVLGREVSIPEMEKIRASTAKELEVFVHGALCVSYSGQCLTSESLGGRSANRGQCAQSCRLGYDLVVDGEARPMGARQFLVSPQDLCGLQDIPKLTRIGIESFKIEGRLKSPEYVASTTRAYKERAIGALADSTARERSQQLARIYSRGFFNGWFDGVNHQKLVNPVISSHHGVALGPVVEVQRDSLVIQADEQITAGDGVVLKDFSRGTTLGATVFSAKRERAGWRVSFGRSVSLKDAAPGMQAFLNSSPHLEGELKGSFSDKHRFKRVPITVFVTGSVSSPLRAEARDPDGNVVKAETEAALEPAQRAPLSAQSVRDELGALGGTVFSLTGFEFGVTGECFIHNRELKELRRKLCAELAELRRRRAPIAVRAKAEVLQWHSRRTLKSGQTRGATKLSVLVRDAGQLDGLSALSIDTIYLDFEFGKEYGPAAERVRGMGYRVGIATTRILKPGELAHLKVIERIRPDEVLVRNLGALQYLSGKGLNLVGDFSLNASNSLTAAWLAEKGLARITPSYDLNAEQLLELARSTDASQLEVTAHHYIPAFHMEHCVFAAFLSSGSSYRDCGRPCEKHRVELRDRNGALHPLKADAECRNTMFNGAPQSAAKLVPSLRELGVSHFRVEGLFEEASTLRRKVEAYAALMRDDTTPELLVKSLGVSEKFGVTDGQLYNIRGYRDRKKAFTALTELQGSADPGLELVGSSDGRRSQL